MCIRDSPCEEDDKIRVVSAITEAFNDMETSTVDGVRVRFKDDNGEYVGWYLARKSNTEPVLVMRMEALSESTLQTMMDVVTERVSGIINIEKLLTA